MEKGLIVAIIRRRGSSWSLSTGTSATLSGLWVGGFGIDQLGIIVDE